MKNDIFTPNQGSAIYSQKKKGWSGISRIPSEPLSSFCNNPVELEEYLDRRILDFHKALPKRFVRYLTSREYPRTIGDLLASDAKELRKSRGIGVKTVDQIVSFLDNIPKVAGTFDLENNPGFFIGPDIRSCFQNHQSLFAGLGQLQIRWFECFIPSNFVDYLYSHPELVTVKDILKTKTKELLKENDIGVITLKQLLDFLSSLPDLNFRMTSNPYRRVRNGAYCSVETRMSIQDDEWFYLYDILEIFYCLTSNFISLLSDRDRMVIQRRFAARKVLHEIASEFHISRQRIDLIVKHHTQMLKRPLSIFEIRFKKYIVQMLYDMDGFIDDMLYPEDPGSVLYVNLLSYVYPSLPTMANSLTNKRIRGSKYLSNMKHRLMEQEIKPYQYTFKSLCQSMGIIATNDAMNLYRIILCGHGVGFGVRDGVVYVVKSEPEGGD